ncbi:subtilase family domain protein [Fusarium sp. NRRL 52700]|nr:subtilase family domain protein [Fusarium sp. NRRL 52700]
MRQILSNPDLPTIFEDQQSKRPLLVQPKLQGLCSLLNRLVNLALVSNVPNVTQNKVNQKYPNLSLLVQVLNETHWNFDLVSGRGNVLFNLNSEDEANTAQRVARRFSAFFSHSPQLVFGNERQDQPKYSSWRLRQDLRDPAVRGLRSLSLVGSEAGSGNCIGHDVVVKLPDWQNIDQEDETTVLDIFLSTCLKRDEWHEACCVVRSTMSYQGFYECTFCTDLTDARATGNIFCFTCHEGQLYMSLEDPQDRPADPNYQPTTSLHSLIKGYRFADPRTYYESVRTGRKPRFYKTQKRALAARLALCLSLYLDSEYTLKAWDSKSVLFMNEDPRNTRNLAYVTSARNNECQDFDRSVPAYTSLAKLLLELECGVSQDEKTHQQVLERVDDMLYGTGEELDAEDLDGTVDMREPMARKMYLEACEEQAFRLPLSAHRRIRIAVLDTGVNRNSGSIIGAILTKRIQCKSWVGIDVQDTDGHGTRVAELILKVAPNADILICKVFRGSQVSADEVENIAEAIDYAVKEDIDIISMSFGLQPLLSTDSKLRKAYRKIEKAIDNARHKILFAAAANHGGHGPRTFPANDPRVICIHASDGKGNDGGINPTCLEDDLNFMTLGLAVTFGDGCKSGTSYSAPIAAGLAAQTLYVADHLMRLTPAVRLRLRTGQGMRAMFKLMSEKRSSYRFVAPWANLWTHGWHLDDNQIKIIEGKMLEIPRF